MKKTISMIIVGTALTVSAQAELLVSWVTNTTDARTAQVSPSYTADLSAININAVGFGAHASKHGTSTGGGANFYVRGDVIPTAQGDNYISFGITPGMAFDLERITMNIGATTKAGTTNIPVTFTLSLYSSLDNYADAIGANSLNYTTEITTGSDVAQLYNFNLGGVPDMQSVDGEVTFRLYISAVLPDNNNGQISTDDILRFYGITLNGATAVPEPSVWVLLGTGVVLLTLLRRKP